MRDGVPIDPPAPARQRASWEAISFRLLLGVAGALGIARSRRLSARALDGLFMAPLICRRWPLGWTRLAGVAVA